MRYLLCGRCVDSAIPLPLLPARSDHPEGLRIRLDTGSKSSDRDSDAIVLAEMHWNDRQGLSHSRTNGGYRLRYPSFCEAGLSGDLGELVLNLAPDRTEEEAALLVIGGITAFMLTVQGRPPLHGSAVFHSGRTLGFLGGSGAGKSTLAALYCLDGAELLADDLVAFGPDDRVLRGSAEVRLRPAANELVSRFPPARVRKSVDGRFAVRCSSEALDAPPPSALIAPILSKEATSLRVKKLLGAQAFLALASTPRQLGLKDSTLICKAFEYFASIARRFPVLEAIIPTGRLRDPALPAELNQQLDGLL